MANENGSRTSHIGRLLLELSHDFTAEANAIIRKKGYEFVRAPHVAVLAQIDEEGTELSEVVRRAGTSKQAINKVVRQLESHGVLDVSVSERDSRARILKFTPFGRRFLRTGLEAVRKVEELYSKALGEKDFERVRHDLARLAELRSVFTRDYDEE